MDNPNFTRMGYGQTLFHRIINDIILLGGVIFKYYDSTTVNLFGDNTNITIIAKRTFLISPDFSMDKHYFTVFILKNQVILIIRWMGFYSTASVLVLKY